MNTERDNWTDITPADATDAELRLVHTIYGNKPELMSCSNWRTNMAVVAASIRAHVKSEIDGMKDKSVAHEPAEHSASDLLEWAWSIIANASGGDWSKESADWQAAAARWRDEWHQTLPAKPEPQAPQVVRVVKIKAICESTLTGRLSLIPEQGDPFYIPRSWYNKYKQRMANEGDGGFYVQYDNGEELWCPNGILFTV
jgi:hypothetical protein